MTFTVTDNNPTLFDSVEVDPLTGILTLDYAAGEWGTADLTVQATDSRLTWTITTPTGGGTAAFYEPGGTKDDTGAEFRVYGATEGDVILQGRISGNDEPVAEVRARVVTEESIPFRVNFLHGKSAASTVTVARAEQIIAVSNVLFRQVGITLAPDTNATESILGDDVQAEAPGTTGLAPATVVVTADTNGIRDSVRLGDDDLAPNFVDITAGANGIAESYANETITKLQDGYFKIERVLDTYVRNVTSTNDNHSSAFNYRAGVINFNMIDSTVPGSLGRTVRIAANSFSAAGGNPSGEFITRLDEHSVEQRMQLISAPYEPIDGNNIIGLVISDATATGGLLDDALVFAHETSHGLGLNHRGKAEEVIVPALADELLANPKNLMNQTAAGGVDIDLMQLLAILGSELM
ncbi:MAG: hypothetical protein HQ567_14500 [Candidatus Nealsonbacteria bacterium]|nr:hypothetical protein [Candidatus Nealsonbacteria bacterium]